MRFGRLPNAGMGFRLSPVRIVLHHFAMSRGLSADSDSGRLKAPIPLVSRTHKCRSGAPAISLRTGDMWSVGAGAKAGRDGAWRQPRRDRQPGLAEFVYRRLEPRHEASNARARPLRPCLQNDPARPRDPSRSGWPDSNRRPLDPQMRSGGSAHLAIRPITQCWYGITPLNSSQQFARFLDVSRTIRRL